MKRFNEAKRRFMEIIQTAQLRDETERLRKQAEDTRADYERKCELAEVARYRTEKIQSLKTMAAEQGKAGQEKVASENAEKAECLRLEKIKKDQDAARLQARVNRIKMEAEEVETKRKFVLAVERKTEEPNCLENARS